MYLRHLFYGPVALALIGCSPPAPGATCAAGEDTDGDGLDDCTELELGTDPASDDSDGDGMTDLAEVDCVSDPLDGDEVCYACGWKHNDPGTLRSNGSSVGDTVANVGFVDQCGEDLPLWDLAGEYHILFMTAAW
jgi:hypothetical protein